MYSFKEFQCQGSSSANLEAEIPIVLPYCDTLKTVRSQFQTQHGRSRADTWLSIHQLSTKPSRPVSLAKHSMITLQEPPITFWDAYFEFTRVAGTHCYPSEASFLRSVFL